MSEIILLNQISLGPSDFAAWRDEIDMCACEPCMAANANRPLDFFGFERLVACVALLEHLKSGRHEHRSYAQAAADARARAIVNGTYGRTVIRASLSGIGCEPFGRPR